MVIVLSLNMVKNSSFILVFLESVKSPVFIVFLIKFIVSLSIIKPSFVAYLIALNILVGSSIKLKLWSTFILLSFKSFIPPNRSIRRPNSLGFKDIARVFIVKSLLARSSFKLAHSIFGRAAGSL